MQLVTLHQYFQVTCRRAAKWNLVLLVTQISFLHISASITKRNIFWLPTCKTSMTWTSEYGQACTCVQHIESQGNRANEKILNTRPSHYEINGNMTVIPPTLALMSRYHWWIKVKPPTGLGLIIALHNPACSSDHHIIYQAHINEILWPIGHALFRSFLCTCRCLRTVTDEVMKMQYSCMSSRAACMNSYILLM